MPSMDENEIVAAVCDHLTTIGYQILERRHTREQGVDIVAKNPEEGGKLFIEAKGGTSSRTGSARFGKEYSVVQVRYCVAQGVFTGLHMRCNHPDQSDKIALAFPDTVKFRKYLKQVEPALGKLEIGVYLVKPDRSICSFEQEDPLQLADA